MNSIQVYVVRKGAVPAFQEAERLIKRWAHQSGATIGVAPPTTRFEDAFERAREFVASPESGHAAIVVALGLEPFDPSSPVTNEDLIEIIAFRQNFEREPATARPATSPAVRPPVVTAIGELDKSLHKSVLRLGNRLKGVKVREINATELEKYFRLRYDVYKPAGYIPAEYDAQNVGWEVHFSDRWSFPMGAFIGEELIGCARLVSLFGVETGFVAPIDRLVRDKDDEVLRRCWRIPGGLPHPFDLLEPFPGFGTYYRELVQAGLKKAELSRVIVAPGHQRQGLGEHIVDESLRVARKRDYKLVMLACQKKHGHFYEQSGFKPIPGMACERFGQFPVPAIAMEHWFVPKPPKVGRQL